MSKGKLLLLDSHHFPTKETEALWADVWIQTTVKPGRTRRYLAPVLMGMSDIEGEEKLNAQMKHQPEPEHAAARAAFAAGATHYIAEGVKDMAGIYAPERWITKAIAERLCLAYAQANGIHATRVKWKRSKIFTTPT